MFRRIVICLPLTVFLLTVSFAEAQQPKKVHLIGYLAPGDAARGSARSEAIRLRALGYVEGQNIAIEYDIRRGRSLFISGRS
jgi:hypothetical protein